MNHSVSVGLNNITQKCVRPYNSVKFLFHLSDKGIFRSFTFVDLAPGEFPQAAQMFFIVTLGNEVPVVGFDNRANNIYRFNCWLQKRRSDISGRLMIKILSQDIYARQSAVFDIFK